MSFLLRQEFLYIIMLWTVTAAILVLFICLFSLSVLEKKIAEFSNSVDLDEVTHKVPPHLDLHCLPSSL